MRVLSIFIGGVVSLGLFLGAPNLALAAKRVLMTETMRVVDRATGRGESFPGRSGYSYEVLSLNHGHAVVRVFSPGGDPLEGDFLVEEGMLPDSLKGEIAAGLKAAAGGGPNGKKLGCCEVIDETPEPKEPEHATRGPAIAPGAKIVYAEPKPLPRSLPLPPPRPERLIATTGSRDGGLCQSFNAFRAKGVPAEPLRQALFFLNKAKKERKLSGANRYVAIADYSQNSRKERFYLLDLQTGSVTREKASHGGGSRKNGFRGDPNHDGNLNACGGSGSAMTRAGFFSTGGYYKSVGRGRLRWPLLSRNPARNGVKLHGLSPGVNDDAEEDGVVMHEAVYNSGGNAPMGRSHGCPAFVKGRGAPLLAKMVSDSALLYSYAPVCKAQMNKVLRQVNGWEGFCK